MSSNQNNDDGYTLLATRLENAAASLQENGKLASNSFLEDLLKAIAILKRIATSRVRARSDTPKRVSGSAFEGIANDKTARSGGRPVNLDIATPPRRNPGLGMAGVAAVAFVIIGGAIGVALLAKHAVDFSRVPAQNSSSAHTEISEPLSMQ